MKVKRYSFKPPARKEPDIDALLARLRSCDRSDHRDAFIENISSLRDLLLFGPDDEDVAAMHLLISQAHAFLDELTTTRTTTNMSAPCSQSVDAGRMPPSDHLPEPSGLGGSPKARTPPRPMSRRSDTTDLPD